MGSRGVQENPALIPTRKPVRRWRRRLCWLLALATLLLLLYAGRYQVLGAAARFLNISEPAQSTDYVMVLGGDMQTRPFVAAALLNAGLARKAVVATIKASGEELDGIVPPEQEIIRSVLLQQGVSPEAIVILDRECANTFDEARALAEFLQTQPHSSVTVVTSVYHTRRARLIFRKMLGKGIASLHFLGAPTDGFHEANWWRFDSGVRFYLNEYFKLAYYVVRY